MKEKYIREVRAFNRFYTVFMGILNKRFLRSRYSLAETRVLHSASTRPGISPSEIISMLNVDKSYLSRMIDRLEKKKLLTRKRSEEDGRGQYLFITPFGEQEFAGLNKASDREVGKLLKKLNEKECHELVECMRRIEKLLKKD